MELSDLYESPAFILLVGGSILATILGWKMSASFGATFPWWQLIIIILGEIIASAFFAMQMSDG